MSPRTPRVVAVLVVVALATVACGGGSDDADSGLDTVPTEQVGDVDEGASGETVVTGSSAPTPIVVADSGLDTVPTDQVGDVDEGASGETVVTGSSAPTPIVLGDAIVDLHGPDAGVAATLYALDAGYSVAQLAAAALDGTLGVDGSIAGVAPAGVDQGVIAAPVAGIRRSTDAPERTAEEVQREIDRKLATVETIQWLGAPLGVADDISYEDVFPSEPELDPDTKEAAAATIGVMAALVDLGYSFDQVVNGFIFGEAAAAIGVDRSGETFTGLSLDGDPVAACIALRDATGRVILPDGTGHNVLLASATCGRAIRAGTISFDGIDRLLRSNDADPVAATTTTAAPTTTSTTTLPEVVPLPWTYEGTIERQQTYTATFGARGHNTAVNDDHIEVTLHEDGTVTGFVTRGPHGSSFECLDPSGAGLIYASTGESETTEITTWSHSDGVLTLPDIPTGTTGGTYDAEAMELTWESSAAIGPLDGCFGGTFTAEETWVDAIIPRVDPPAGG